MTFDASARPRGRIAPVFLACSIAMPSGAGATAQPPPAPPEASTALDVREDLLAEIGGEMAAPPHWAVTADGAHIAWREAVAKQWKWVVKGQPEGKLYDEVGAFRFSKVAGRTAYAARRGKKWMAVVDGVEGPEFDDVAGLIFSEDGTRYGYRGKKEPTYRVVVDGKEETFGDSGGPVFSPDGKTVAFIGCAAKKCTMRVNGTAHGPEAEWWVGPLFSADGKRLAAVGVRGKTVVSYVDGKEGVLDAAWAGNARFSRDGSRFAFLAHHKGDSFVTRNVTHWFYVVDGQAGPVFDVVGDLAFSPLGDRHAYAGVRVKGVPTKIVGTVVVDGKEGPAFTAREAALKDQLGGILRGLRDLFPSQYGVSDPSFSPDGQVVYVAQKDDAQVLMVGETAGPPFETVTSSPAFGPNNEVAYVVGQVKTARKMLEVREGKVTAQFPVDANVSMGYFTRFSPDGQRLAYVLGSGGKAFGMGYSARARRRVVVDGQPGKEYDVPAITEPLFSSDSRHLAYAVVDLRGDKSLVVFDGHEGRPYDAVAAWSLRFVSDREVEYFARDGRRFVRVKQALR